MPTIALDFETYYDKDYGIQTHGLYGYTHHEKFDPYMISVSDGEQSWAGQPSDFNWSALEGADVIAHNAAFDWTVYDAMVEQGLAPKVGIKSWQCTANMSAYICNRRSLADAVKYLLGVDVDKSMRNYMKGKSWKQAQEEGKAQKLLEYARLDAKHCFDIWNKFSPLWPEHERELSTMTMEQCRYGVQVDVPKLDRYIGLAQDSLKAIEKSIPWLETSDKGVTSPKAIAEQCRKNGIPVPPIKSHEDGEEKFRWWEATYGAKYDWVRAISMWRVMNKFLGSLERVKMWLRPDGTMPFSLKYFGAHTGRWSGDNGFNMQNLRNKPIYLKEDMLPYEPGTDEPLDGLHVLDIRSIFIARPGKIMVLSDLAQIEPRVLGWCCGNTKLLDLVRGGMSVYEVHARQSLGWTGGDLKKLAKKDPAAALLYKRAKAEVLALGYGCGPQRYVDAAMTMAGYKVEEEQAEKEVAEFRERNPLIAGENGIWKQLDIKFKNSIGQSLIVELPGGRCMKYPKVRRAAKREKVEDPDRPGKTKWVNKLVYTADVGGIRKKMYGGLLTENLIQAAAREVFAYHLLKLKKVPGIRILFTVHDEAVLELDNEGLIETVTAIMSETPPWLKGCPIACEAAVVKHYLK